MLLKIKSFDIIITVFTSKKPYFSFVRWVCTRITNVFIVAKIFKISPIRNRKCAIFLIVNLFVFFGGNFLSGWNPPDPFSFAPFTNALSVWFQIDFNAHPVFRILDPRSSILFPIWVCHSAITLFSTSLEISFKLLAITPLFPPKSVHICIFEPSSVSFV